MDNKELVRQVAMETGLPKAVVRPALAVAFGVLRDNLISGLPVILPGIGTVHHKFRKGRTAKTLPGKGAFVQPDSYYLKLKNSKSLKESLRSLCVELGGEDGLPAISKPLGRRTGPKKAHS